MTDTSLERSLTKPGSTWTCPECGRRFSRKGQQHVCDTTSLEDHLGGKGPVAIDMFQNFANMVAACGPFEYAPIRRQIGFRVNRIFAVVQITESGLRGYLDLPRHVVDERFRHASPYTKRLWVHHFSITAREQMDATFAGWVREAYEVGKGLKRQHRHTESRSGK